MNKLKQEKTKNKTNKDNIINALQYLIDEADRSSYKSISIILECTKKIITSDFQEYKKDDIIKALNFLLLYINSSEEDKEEIMKFFEDDDIPHQKRA
jgi:hypothetical protein